MCAYYIPASHPGQYYQQPSFQPPASTYGGYGIPPGYAPTAYSDPGYARYSNDPYRYAGGGNTINVGGSVYSDGPRYATSPIGGAGPSWAGGSNYGRGAEPGPSPYRYNEPASAHYDPHRNGYLYPNAPQASQHPTDHSYGSEHRSRGRSRSRSQSRERRHSTGSYYPAGVPLGAKSQTYVVPTPANSYSGGGGGTKSGNRDRSRSRGRDTHIHLGSTSRNVSSAALPTNNIPAANLTRQRRVSQSSHHTTSRSIRSTASNSRSDSFGNKVRRLFGISPKRDSAYEEERPGYRYGDVGKLRRPSDAGAEKKIKRKPVVYTL